MTDPTNVTIRGMILERAKALTEGDRNKSYGEPKPNLEAFADMVDTYLSARGEKDYPLNAVDASVLMILAKISRVAVNQHHMDNYLDIAAYAAIAGECAEFYKREGEQ